MANIKQIKVGSTTYDIEALHFITGSLDTPAQWKAYIDSLVGEGLQIKIDTKSSSGDYPATAASASTMGKLYMVQLTGQTESGTYTEFITVDTDPEGSHNYVWEKIGTTAADLSEYAKVGTYTSTAPSTNATGSAGSETINTTDADLGSATGSAKIDSHSISAHSHTVNEATISIGSASGWSAGTLPSSASFTYVSGVKATGGTASALTGVKASGTANANTDAIKEFTLSASTTTTAGPAYVEDVSHTAASLTGTKTFNTDAIKSVTLSASDTSTDGPIYVQDITGAISGVSLSESETSTDGPQYVKSISGSAPSLGGTKTFNTDAIKSVSLSASTASADGPAYVQSVSGTFNTDAIKDVTLSASDTTTAGPAYVQDASLSGTTTFVTGYGSFSGGSGGFTPTTKYMKITTTATSAADKGTVTLSGGSATGTFNTDAIKAVAGTKNYGFSASTSTIMYNPVVNDGVLSWSTANAGTQDAHTGTAASTGSVSYTAPTLGGTTSFLTTAVKSASLSASDTSTDGPKYIQEATHAHNAASLGSPTTKSVSLSKTVKYMSHTTTAASTGSVGSTVRYMKATGTAASTGTVTISGGSYSATTRYMKSTGSNAGITKTQKYMKPTGTAASTGTVGISGGSISKTIKYMSHTVTAASTTSVVTGVTSNGTATVILSTGLDTASANQITGVGTLPSLTVTSKTVLTTGTTLDTAGATTLTHTGTGSTTVPVTVAIGSHHHSVTTSNHTHTLSNHTHNVSITNP